MSLAGIHQGEESSQLRYGAGSRWFPYTALSENPICECKGGVDLS